MSAKKRGLGRGFGSLIPDELLDESFDPTATQDEQVSDLRNIKLSQITPDPDQPRRHFDEAALEALAASIVEHGVLQPIVVVPKNDGYMIVAGERRWRAANKAGIVIKSVGTVCCCSGLVHSLYIGAAAFYLNCSYQSCCQYLE